MAGTDNQFVLGNSSLRLDLKETENGYGYLLLTRKRDNKEYKVCLFRKHWQVLKPLIRSISLELHNRVENVHRWLVNRAYSWNLETRQKIVVKRLSGKFHIVLHMVDERTVHIFKIKNVFKKTLIKLYFLTNGLNIFQEKESLFWLDEGEWSKFSCMKNTIDEHINKKTEPDRELTREELQSLVARIRTLQWDYLETSGRLNTLKKAALYYIDMALEDCKLDVVAASVLKQMEKGWDEDWLPLH
jgi:hypothetical protein